MLAASTRLGPYEIVAPLGAGGMGEVYRARDTRLGREVALKVLPESFANDPDRQSRFEREARAVAALSHPNILAIHDYGSQDNVIYAVMELLEGETLRVRLARGPLPWRTVVEIGGAIAEGLAAAHAKGVVHRDLKPENLFLTTDSRVKILDFGLAQWQPLPDPGAATAYVPARTDLGVVLGTPGYMAPEQIGGDPVDPRTDVFALGCVLYEMVAGRAPFARPTTAEMMTATLRDDPPQLRDASARPPAPLEQLIRRCLEKHPAARFQSAHDLALALRGLDRPESVRRHVSVRLIASIAAAAIVVALIAAGVYVIGWPDPGRGQNAGSTVAVDSVAVLPLVSVGGGPEAEFVGDGITESLINRLSQVPNLRVMARTTVFRYKGRTVDPREVGRELNVRAVLTGHVTQRDGAVIIQADLVDVADGTQLWGERYTPKQADLQAVQEDIAGRIADRLRLRLTGAAAQRLIKRYSDNPEAYQIYLKGLYRQQTRLGTDRESAKLFEQAVQLDPEFALAYAALANSYSYMGNYNILPPEEASPKARAAALKALELDEELGEAHTALAYVRMNYDWDWVSAGKEYRRALELNPGYATGHSLYAWYCAAQGRFDEALKEISKVLELDPLAATEYVHAGWHHHMAGRPNEAVEVLRKAEDLDPQNFRMHTWLGLVYTRLGKHEEAIAEFRKGVDLSGRFPQALAALAHGYGVAGRRAEAEKVLSELKELDARQYVSAYDLALVYVGLGDKKQALEALESAYRQRDGWLAGWIKVDPRLEPLRTDPQFADLLRRVGLTP